METNTEQASRAAGSDAGLGSVDHPDRWDEGFAAAINALKEMCDERMGSFRGYSWDSGAGSSGYDEALREVMKWADTVCEPALPNVKGQPRSGESPGASSGDKT